MKLYEITTEEFNDIFGFSVNFAVLGLKRQVRVEELLNKLKQTIYDSGLNFYHLIAKDEDVVFDILILPAMYRMKLDEIERVDFTDLILSISSLRLADFVLLKGINNGFINIMNQCNIQDGIIEKSLVDIIRSFCSCTSKFDCNLFIKSHLLRLMEETLNLLRERNLLVGIVLRDLDLINFC